MRVVVCDPSAQVPYYDRALAAALCELGAVVTLATAPDLYYDPGPPPAGVTTALCFGRLTSGRLAEVLRLAERPGLRRLLRGAGYGPEVVGLVRLIRRAAPNVLHLQWSLAPLVDAMAVAVIRAGGTRVVYTAHNVLPHGARWWHAPSYARLYRSVDHLVVHSSAAAQRAADLGLSADRVTVIPMAAGDAASPARERSRRAARLRLGLPESDRVVLFFGQIRPYKGLAVLLDAAALLQGRVPGARLLVAGPVAGGRDELRRIGESVSRLGLAEMVDFRPGYVPDAQVGDLFAASDVVALPYVETDDSAVLLTARAYARAVVASAVGGLPEALAAGGGRLVPPRDPEALAEALEAVLIEPGVQQRLEEDARAAAATRTWRDVARNSLALYERLVEGER